MKKPAPILVFLLFLTVAFTLATVIQPHALGWSKRGDSGGVLKVLLGDGRRMFAQHFFIKADIYFHSGYYPSIFDQAQAPKDSQHMTHEEEEHEADEHEKEMNFLGPPRDWIERFGRHFLITDHTHLKAGNEREILPWLRIAAELDPQRIETYTVASYWLRRSLGKPEQAELFLREGLRNNPEDYELLFELGCLYSESLRDNHRARNVWELALRRWQEQEPSKKEPDLITLEKIIVHLARLEEKTGNLRKAIDYLKMAFKTSPNPQALQQQIAELEEKVSGGGQ